MCIRQARNQQSLERVAAAAATLSLLAARTGAVALELGDAESRVLQTVLEHV